MTDIIKSRFTPRDVNYPSCADVYAEFFVYSRFEDAEKLFQGNVIKPDFQQVVGDTFTNKLDRVRIAKLDLWGISTDKKVVSKDARDHLDYLLSKLIIEKKAILSLQKNYKMGVKCVWFASSTGGPAVWPEQMSILSELNLELAFSVYCLD
ncbi:DUF4279 domain-containing protein [Psychrobacter sp. FDAARGOS_221]|uniref:DUF4279 domain-containing protein n=1 Tax=Psychrobacter sp. FDAARGOS_221 TaxID=1975705 RepID=UPI000BB59EB5|nr:DUF4279 domain-containing protein [Psychrobacter sp. FDAARGOS_221]PNK61594.1 DUF4279 domain-containing protein [Psychrobacter sp. FDAARGOS_221]